MSALRPQDKAPEAKSAQENSLAAADAGPFPFVGTADASLRKLAILDEDEAFIESLKKLLLGKGYEIHAWRPGEDISAFLREAKPHMILMDTEFEGKNGFAICRELKGDSVLGSVPVLFASEKTSLKDRVEAVRAGGEGYFVKPLSPEPFLQALELMGVPHPDVPIRVLSVEDDPVQVAFLRKVLEGAGYLFEACLQPEEMLETLDTFNPDLLLMDIAMPGFSGFELARAVRQDSRFLMLPIVFLTVREKVSEYIEGLQAGSDDYLVKPVDPEILLNCVRTRSRRALLMRTLSNQDSLTLLYNRSSLMRQLDGFFSRAGRYGETLTIGMIDLDGFKKFNDTHGHQAGDGVLRDTAHFLRQKLRDSDVIGRYGGEEFVVLLPQLPVEDAFCVMDRLREEFASKEYTLPNGESVKVSFSGGLASFPNDGRNRETLLAAADAALYVSKRAGRNRLTIAGS